MRDLIFSYLVPEPPPELNGHRSGAQPRVSELCGPPANVETNSRSSVGPAQPYISAT